MPNTRTDNLQPKIDKLIPRPPIVVVMGHVDHGKTSLLDFIRRTNIAAKEARAITQSIGAYEIEVCPKDKPKSRESEANRGIPRQMPRAFGSEAQARRDDFAIKGRKITFIDTPGHEAFSKMRSRGAGAADLGILVVAADEGVKPQTEEAIKTLRETKTPFVVAINKIDKLNADVERIKNELTQAGVLLEGFGGDISWQAVSAQTGQGVNELLDLILLSAEVENFTYSRENPAMGVIIETELDNQRGLTVAIIVKDGILKRGDKIVTPTASGKIKILENFLGRRVESLEPSSPALILGFDKSPLVGEEFFAGDESLEVGFKKESPFSSGVVTAVVKKSEGETLLLSVILKTDVSGSLEVISEIIKAFPGVKIFRGSIGQITDGDVKDALSAKAVIVGFKTKVTKAAENLAKSQNIKIITSEIIYELIKEIEREIKLRSGPIILGKLEILAVFGKKSNNQKVVGGRVVEGVLKINASLKIQRGGQDLGLAKIINLQREKNDVQIISQGEECGLLVETNLDIDVGDYLISEENANVSRRAS